MADYVNFRMWRSTRIVLRMIYALTGESIISIVDRLAKEELKKIQENEQQQ